MEEIEVRIANLDSLRYSYQVFSHIDGESFLPVFLFHHSVLCVNRSTEYYRPPTFDRPLHRQSLVISTVKGNTYLH